MKDKGILFTKEMADAANEGRKTQTRPIQGLKKINARPDAWEKPRWNEYTQFWEFLHILEDTVTEIKCPYEKGQRLYLKEAHYRYGKWVDNGETKKTHKQAWRFIAEDRARRGRREIVYFEDNVPTRLLKRNYRKGGWYKRSPLLMPKKFARSWYVVTEDPVPERVQDITPQDAAKEGVIRRETTICLATVNMFEICWNKIHGPVAWERNEYAWKVTFEKIEV